MMMIMMINTLGDVDCTVTAINQRRLPPMLLNYSVSAPSWMRTTAADGHKGFKQKKLPSRSLKLPVLVPF